MMLGASRVVLFRRRLLLDGRTDVAAAFSLRRVNSKYAGPLVRVRRSSDSTEKDFGAGSPAVSWAQISDFIGAGNAFAVKWYEQFNGRDFSQSTAAAQPQIVPAANGFPALLGDGVNDCMTTAAFAVNQPISFNVVYRRVTNAQASFMNLFESSAADAVTLYRKVASGGSGNSMYSGSEFLSNDTAQPTGTRGVAGGAFSGASSLMEVNAAAVSSFTGDANTLGLNGLTLFTSFDQSATRFDNSEAQELVLFNAAHTSNQLKADNAVMRSAWRF